MLLLAATACSRAPESEATPSTGTTRTHRPPEYVAADFDTFFRPYRTAFAEVSGSISPDRELVQLGLPDSNKVVLWYALARNAASGGPVNVTVNGSPVPTERVRQTRNARYNTGRVEILGLQSGTTYQVELSGGGLSGQRAVNARTADSANKPFSFLFASCFVPYSTKGEIAHIGRGERASMRNFRDRAAVSGPDGPAFFIGLGDQMYTDPGATEDNPQIAYLFGDHSHKIRGTAETVPDYLGQLYRYAFGLPAMDSALAMAPSVMMWDDHDVRDGWGSQNDEHHPEWRNYYRNARDAFVAYQASRNPNFESIVNARHWDRPHREAPLADEDGFEKRQVEETHFTFDRGYATFFVADGRSAKWRGPQLGGQQYEDIRKWLENPARHNQPTVFVFAYPVPVMGSIGVPFAIAQRFESSNQDDALDRIHLGDYKKLTELFATHFARERRHTLVIISGDVHYTGLQSIRQGGKEGRTYGYEIISSGLAQTEYNHRGPLWGTVSGVPRIKLSLPDSLTPWVQDHGVYIGPSFAELFIDAPKDAASPPRLGLEFYPAVLRNAAWNLRSEPRVPGWPHSIESYPENKPIWYWFGRRTRNRLPELMGKWWLDGGRAIRDTSYRN